MQSYQALHGQVHCPYLSESSSNNSLRLCLFFQQKKHTHTHKTFSLSLKIFRKHFSFFLPQRLCTQYSSVSFAWNVFQLIPHDWFFLSLLLQLKCHLQGGRDYLIITLKGHRRYPVTLLFFPYKYKIHAFACLATHNEL